MSEEALEVLYEGGTLTHYKCGDVAKCLTITNATKTITENDSIRGRVKTAFDALTVNIQNNTAPSAANVALINGTSIPIWRALNVYSSYSGPILETAKQPLIDLVANDVMLSWIESPLEINFRASSSELSARKSDEWKDDLVVVRFCYRSSDQTRRPSKPWSGCGSS